MTLLTWMGWSLGCTACTPNIDPNLDTSPPEQHTGEDSEVDTQPIDTQPPPPCEQPEVEPNAHEGEATPIALEEQACGDFSAGLDLDFYAFSTPGAGWFEIDVDAGDRGSAANPNLSLANEDGDLKLNMSRSATSSDPHVVVPLAAADDWILVLNEETTQGGDTDYDYFFRVSQTKDPVTWDVLEDDDHGGFETAQELELGTTVFGTMESASERDWYVITAPEAKTDLNLEVLAHRAGSPIDAVFQVWTLTKDGELNESPEDWVSSHPTQPGNDPQLTKTGHGLQVWYVMVRSEGSTTGPLYWYTFTVEEVSE